MASQVPREHVYGNFKKPKDERKNKNSRARDERDGMDPEHLANLRRCPCIVPGCTKMPGGVAHHLRHGPAAKERGGNLRATDQWALPFCDDHHNMGFDNVHMVGSKIEGSWFKSHSIPHPLQAAISLYAARGNLPRMIAITIAVKTG